MTPAPPPPAEHADLRSLAERVAREAGALLRDRLHHPRTVDTKSSPTDAVTDADRAAAALIVARLAQARPDDGLLGEEGTNHAGTTGYRWCIDPLDGTVNYLYRRPGYCVSVGVELDGRPVAGAVYDPTLDECYSAHLGGGATRNGQSIAVSGQTRLDLALLGTGFAYDAGVRARQAAALAHVIPVVRDIRRGGSAALDLCWVACGRLDAYAEHGLNPWDYVAGTLIAAEAGATVELVAPPDLPIETWMAASPAIHTSLRALLVSAYSRERT